MSGILRATSELKPPPSPGEIAKDDASSDRPLHLKPGHPIRQIGRWALAGALMWTAPAGASEPPEVARAASGPTGSGHWAFQPVRRPTVPAVRDAARVRNEIDAFMLADLESRGATLPPPASPAVLLRRLHLDLTGLPPTLDEQRGIDGFSAPTVIDTLLARPEYGERWARHWLDVVRYADSNGYERDAEKPFVWRYRDYVIEAFNRDLPFDRFVIEQLAGDELPDRTVTSHIATGFLRLGHWDDEPADPAADRYDQLDDIVSTTGQAFLALTIGCARCHDHKFEPLSARDYYGLLAVFAPLERPRDGRTEKTVTVEGTEVYALRETGPGAPEVHVLVRGDPGRPREAVGPAVPAVLAVPSADFPPPGEATTRRRLGFARWLTSEHNPLTARVLVNRVWQQHFGQGLVTTANNFGVMGAPPTHPDLLDWLAHWFMHEGGWSLKNLHRLILGSSTWQTVHAANAPLQYRRLEVEALRDSMLAVSGRLNRQPFGPAMRPEIPAAALEANTDRASIWKASDEQEASRRSIYAFIKRGLLVPLFESLDLADTVTSCPQRQVTTVAPQALTLFNGAFVNTQARHFAERVRHEASDAPADQIRHAWRLALCREPSPAEYEAMTAFLREESLESLCRVVLNLNEFAYPE